MASQTITTCDKCGDTCEYHYHLAMRYYADGPVTHAEVDLCPACFAPFIGSRGTWDKQPQFKPLIAPFMAPRPE